MLSFEEFAFAMEEDSGSEDLTKMSNDDLKKRMDEHLEAIGRETDEDKKDALIDKTGDIRREYRRRFDNLSSEEKVKRLHQSLKSRKGDLHQLDDEILESEFWHGTGEAHKAAEAFVRGNKFRAAGKWGALASGVVGAGYLGYKALSHHNDQPSHEDYLSWENYVRGEYSF